MTIIISSAVYDGERWFVLAFVDDGNGTRSGSYMIEAPESASELDLEAGIAILFA